MDTLLIDYRHSAYEDLSGQESSLISRAIEAMKGAHAPYSNFTVGSAVLLESGHVVIGNNQENAAYPSGLCAERVALFAAKSVSKEPIKAIAIVAANGQGKSADAFACGNCRQVMLEYASQESQISPIKVIMRDSNDRFIILDDVRKLLPFTFDATTLG